MCGIFAYINHMVAKDRQAILSECAHQSLLCQLTLFCALFFAFLRLFRDEANFECLSPLLVDVSPHAWAHLQRGGEHVLACVCVFRLNAGSMARAFLLLQSSCWSGNAFPNCTFRICSLCQVFVCVPRLFDWPHRYGYLHSHSAASHACMRSLDVDSTA